MIKATAIAMLLMVASSTAVVTPKIASQDVYDTMLQWRHTVNSTSSTKKSRDNLGSSCCPVSGLSQITAISYDDAVYLGSALGYFGQVSLSAESCTLVDCNDDGAGLMACNFNTYAIEVPGSSLGAFSDWLAYYCTTDGYTCGVGLDYTLDYNIWTENGACSI